MTRWPLVVMAALIVAGLAADTPARDPFNQIGFPVCGGAEIGYWQYLYRSEGTRQVVYLLLTTVDVLDPAFAICYVPSNSRIQVVGAEYHL